MNLLLVFKITVTLAFISALLLPAPAAGRYYKILPGTSSNAFGLLHDPDYDVLIVAAGINYRIYSFDLATTLGTAICGTGGKLQSTSPTSPGTSFAINNPIDCAFLIQSDTGSVAHYVCSARIGQVLVRIDRGAPHASDVLTGVANSKGFADSPSTVKFFWPYGLVTDRVNKRVYLTDHYNDRIRQVDYTSGGAVTVSTLAGSGATGGADGSPATAATFYNPIFVHIVFGTSLFVSEQGASFSRLRRLYPMSTAGTVSTIFNPSSDVVDSTFGFGIASFVPSGSSSGTLLFFRENSGVEVFNFSSQSFVESGAGPWTSTALPTACAPQATGTFRGATFLPNGSLVSASDVIGTTATDWDLHFSTTEEGCTFADDLPAAEPLLESKQVESAFGSLTTVVLSVVGALAMAFVLGRFSVGVGARGDAAAEGTRVVLAGPFAGVDFDLLVPLTTTTVVELKQMCVDRLFGAVADPEQLGLSFGGEEMLDARTLASYGVAENSVINFEF